MRWAPSLLGAGASAVLLAACFSCTEPTPVRTPISPPPPPPVAAPTPALSDAGPPPEPPLGPPPPPAVATLSDGFDKRLPKRVLVARYGFARVRLDAPPPEIEDRLRTRLHDERVVVETKGNDIRVVLDMENARVLAWLQPVQARQVVSEPTTLESWLGGKAASENIVVYPGLGLEPGREQGDQVEVKAVVHDVWSSVEFSGWLPSDRLTRVYTPAAERERPRETPYLLVMPTQVWHAPGGRVVAKVHVEKGKHLVVYRIGDTKGWLQQIRFWHPLFEMNGFVPDTTLKPTYPGMSRAGTGVGGVGYGPLGNPNERILVPPGTCLYDREAGEVVGVAKRTIVSHVPKPESETGWRTLRLSERYAVEVMVRRDQVEVLPSPVDLDPDEKTMPLPPGEWRCR